MSLWLESGNLFAMQAGEVATGQLAILPDPLGAATTDQQFASEFTSVAIELPISRCFRNMTVRLNHTIVPAKDENASAAFLSSILGLPLPVRLGHFAAVHVGDTSLDFMKTGHEIHQHHYAFLVSEVEFDQIFARIRERGLSYWADPFRHRRDEINAWDDGRGVYFDDPNGHLLEVITRPYGSGGTAVDKPHPLIAPTIDARDNKGPV